jgi:hypothetical protein
VINHHKKHHCSASSCDSRLEKWVPGFWRSLANHADDPLIDLYSLCCFWSQASNSDTEDQTGQLATHMFLGNAELVFGGWMDVRLLEVDTV